MAQQQATFNGTLRWAFTKRLNKYGKFSVDFYPQDDKIRTAIKGLGATRLTLKEGDNGFYYTFRLDPASKYAPKEVLVQYNDGQKYDGIIGDGTTADITVEAYDYDNSFGKGRGIRLLKIEIIRLVEYKGADASLATEPEVPATATAEKKRAF